MCRSCTEAQLTPQLVQGGILRGSEAFEFDFKNSYIIGGIKLEDEKEGGLSIVGESAR